MTVQNASQTSEIRCVENDWKVEMADFMKGGCHIIKSNATEYEYHFIPKGCNCGGTAGLGFGFPTYEIAIWEAIKEAKQIASQGFHYHGGSKKHKNKGGNN